MDCWTDTGRARETGRCSRRADGATRASAKVAVRAGPVTVANRAVRFLYILAVYLAAPIVSLLLLIRGAKDRSYWRNFGERFGFGPRLDTDGVWIHTVSVGEVQAAAPLVASLREHYPD